MNGAGSCERGIVAPVSVLVGFAHGVQFPPLGGVHAVRFRSQCAAGTCARDFTRFRLTCLRQPTTTRPAPAASTGSETA